MAVLVLVDPAWIVVCWGKSLWVWVSHQDVVAPKIDVGHSLYMLQPWVVHRWPWLQAAGGWQWWANGSGSKGNCNHKRCRMAVAMTMFQLLTCLIGIATSPSTWSFHLMMASLCCQIFSYSLLLQSISMSTHWWVELLISCIVYEQSWQHCPISSAHSSVMVLSPSS